MANEPVINNFNGGEQSPYIYARTDLKTYAKGCLKLENFSILPYGGVTRRPPLRFVAESKNNTKIRLVEFQFNVDETYVLEFGNEYIRFFTNQYLRDSEGTIQTFTTPSPVLDNEYSGIPVEVVTPYQTADLFDLQFKQSADVVWIVHPDYPPYRLSRLSNVSWTMDEDVLNYQIFMDENITSTTITPSAVGPVGNTVSLTASATLFDSNHVGSYWQIKHTKASVKIVDANAVGAGPVTPTSITNTLKVQAGEKITFTTTGNWSATDGTKPTAMAIWRSNDAGVTWEQFRYYDMSSRNVDTTWDEVENDILYCITYQPDADPQVGKFTLTTNEPYDIGIVKITAVTSATSATGIVKRVLGATTATKRWSEGAWSAYRGYPAVVSLWESRLIFASTLSQPQTIWLSTVDDFKNFRMTSLDDGAMTLTISSGSLDEIRWLVPQSVLIIGTTSSEWVLEAESYKKPVTPTAFSLRRKTTYGSAKLQGLMVNSVVLFVMRQGRKLREFTYNPETFDYVAPDMTVMAEHITKGGIVDMSYQQQPDNVIMAVRGDGVLIPFTYERDQEITGWQRWLNDEFTFESISIIPREGLEDQVWVSCLITIGGVDKRYIGVFDNREWGTDIINEWNGLDFYNTYSSTDIDYLASLNIGGDDTLVTTDIDGNTYAGGKQVVRLTGLELLEGKTVSVLSDGMVQPSQVVTNGEITTLRAGTRTVVGLPFTSVLAPMYIEPQSQFQQPVGKIKGTIKATVRFKDTVSCKIGQDESRLETIFFRQTDDLMDKQVGLFSGQKKVSLGNIFDSLHTCYVVQDKPLPITVLAMIPAVEVHN